MKKSLFALLTLSIMASILSVGVIVFEMTSPLNNFSFLVQSDAQNDIGLEGNFGHYEIKLDDFAKIARHWSSLDQKAKVSGERMYIERGPSYLTSSEPLPDSSFDYFPVDNLGRRVPFTNIQDQDSERQNYFFAGCSHAYGLNLRTEDTFAYLLQKELPEKNVYPLGVPAFGFHDFIAQLSLSKSEELLNSVFVYYHFSDSINRTLGKVSRCCPPRGPRFIVGEDEKIHYQGAHQKIRWNNFPKIIYYTAMYAHYLNWREPIFSVSPDEIDSYCKLIAKTAEMIDEKFSSKLLLVFAPMAADDGIVFDQKLFNRHCQKYTAHLSNFRTLELSSPQPPPERFYNGHPTAELVRELTPSIIKASEFLR